MHLHASTSNFTWMLSPASKACISFTERQGSKKLKLFVWLSCHPELSLCVGSSHSSSQKITKPFLLSMHRAGLRLHLHLRRQGSSLAGNACTSNTVVVRKCSHALEKIGRSSQISLQLVHGCGSRHVDLLASSRALQPIFATEPSKLSLDTPAGSRFCDCCLNACTLQAVCLSLSFCLLLYTLCTTQVCILSLYKNIHINIYIYKYIS